MDELASVRYISRSSSPLGWRRTADDFREAVGKVRVLGDRAHVLWTDGPRVQACTSS
jgi:hypothetical protein